MKDQIIDYSDEVLADSLREWWKGMSELGPFASKPAAEQIDAALPEIDSLEVTKALLTVEEHVGFDVGTNVIRRGGYNSVDHMVDDLIPKVRSLYEEKKQKMKTSGKTATV